MSIIKSMKNNSLRILSPIIGVIGVVFFLLILPITYLLGLRPSTKNNKK
ncbi:hypothetical protein ER45_027990 (plasmid) [Bacillus mycoides]|nr:hypothetical protein ER45_027990 [Bacillus mycoides]